MKCTAVSNIYSLSSTISNRSFYLGLYAKNRPTNTKIKNAKDDMDRMINKLNTLIYYTEKGLYIDERI